MTTAAETASSNEREIVITREFAAPRQLVWDVWNEPKHIEKWFGPRTYSVRVTSQDFTEGGAWHYVMLGPAGEEFPFSGVFQEIVPIEKVVSTDEFDESLHETMPDLPKGLVVTTLFDEQGPKTLVTIRTIHGTVEDRKKHEAMGVVAGWESSFEKMDEYLAELQK
jgi:uncharacterized protein YndB with AHSA1/START domain